MAWLGIPRETLELKQPSVSVQGRPQKRPPGQARPGCFLRIQGGVLGPPSSEVSAGGRGGLTSLAGLEGSAGRGCVTGAPELQPRAGGFRSLRSIRKADGAAMKPAKGNGSGCFRAGLPSQHCTPDQPGVTSEGRSGGRCSSSQSAQAPLRVALWKL